VSRRERGNVSAEKEIKNCEGSAGGESSLLPFCSFFSPPHLRHPSVQQLLYHDMTCMSSIMRADVLTPNFDDANHEISEEGYQVQVLWDLLLRFLPNPLIFSTVVGAVCL
jgi:hypothetical protein